jgi:uncharacterized protein
MKDEARDAVIGLGDRWNLLYVVHIEQEENCIRIISARKTTRQERTEYENFICKEFKVLQWNFISR